MHVQAVHVTPIEARRFSNADEQPDQVRIDHNSTVTRVQQTDDETATIEFRYTASYGSIGVIKLEGQANFVGDAGRLEATWSAESVAREVPTAEMQSCVPQAVQLSRDLELPPPIPLPRIPFEGDGGQTSEQGGREVH